MAFRMAGIKITNNRAMMAITTKSYINVNPVRNNRDLSGCPALVRTSNGVKPFFVCLVDFVL
jgi:hypothetical protein